ncbi:hypothetical protein J6590_048265 [Homalodisca vitripennis]|nr:hypothetical protein J6590_048265 [Homalodisca vitripennis]
MRGKATDNEPIKMITCKLLVGTVGAVMDRFTGTVPSAHSLLMAVGNLYFVKYPFTLSGKNWKRLYNY